LASNDDFGTKKILKFDLQGDEVEIIKNTHINVFKEFEQIILELYWIFDHPLMS